jgi:hypothetical protein
VSKIHVRLAVTSIFGAWSLGLARVRRAGVNG